MVSSDDSIIVSLKNSIVTKINTLIGNHNSSNTAHSDIRNSIPSKTSDLTNDSNFVSTNDSRLSDARTPTSHQHGNISNDGKVTTIKTIGESTNVSSDYFIISDASDSNATKSANVINVLNKVVLDLIDEGES